MNPPPRHPYFDDRAAARWYRSLHEGVAAAREAGLRLCIVVTSPECGGSRALLERIFPKEEITEELRAGFVCVAADLRSLEPAVAELLAQAPRREPTPVCLYAAPSPMTDPSSDGKSDLPRLVFSTAGGRPAAVFLRDLSEARTKR